MRETLARLVWRRANNCCEYCRVPQQYSSIPFEVDHIIPKQHGGITKVSNLALSCFYCNRYKGPNLSGIDPRTRRRIPLFNPRRHRWTRYFEWNGPFLIGRMPVGRATIAVLNLNMDLRVDHRQSLIQEGVFPPT